MSAKSKMQVASLMSGMALSNAYLGINHSMSHKLGQAFHYSHGRCIAITMPHVIRFNASQPKKRAIWAKTSTFRANEDYAEMSRYLWLPGKTTEVLVESYVQAFIKCAHSVGIKLSQ